jgi:AcrR family transcriptional regulator
VVLIGSPGGRNVASAAGAATGGRGSLQREGVIGRREDNKRRKREALLAQGAARFAADGYSAASIEQIASAAGVARGTFYLYFDDKLALFEALVDTFFEPLADVLRTTGQRIAAAGDRGAVAEAYQQMAHDLAVVGLAHADLIPLAFQASRQPHEAGQRLRAREQALIEVVVGFTADAAERGLLDVKHPRVATLVVYGAVERLFYEFLSGSDLGGDPGAVAQEVVGLFGVAMGFEEAS